MKKIAVIGGGSSGLAAIKSCKEEGLDVVCFEKSNDIGGLWRYREEDIHGLASVMKSTVINTQKEMSAFSDFPPPAEYAHYMHNSKMLNYFRMYAEHFQLYGHIRCNQEVVHVSPAADYDHSGRWLVKTKDVESKQISEETFDGVMLCIGHHVHPRMARFPGQDNFQGKILHSHSIKVPDEFKDLNVLVVGIGNSATDVAVDASCVAKQVYLSTRRGSWLITRNGPKGLPTDALLTCRLINFVLTLVGWKLASWLMEYLVVDKKLDHELYGLKPKHRFLSQHPTINDVLPSKITNGKVIIKRNVRTFTKNGVIFDGEDTIIPIDVAVFATGYNITFPFLDDSVLKVNDNKTELFKRTFPPHLKHPSLAVIGMIQPTGSIFPIAENQSRWYASIMGGRIILPDKETMLDDISQRRKATEERYVSSQRHTIQVDYIGFMDEIAEQYGAKPNLLRMAFVDPFLFWVCLTCPCFAYQYRLNGPHRWSGARNAIIKFPNRFTKPFASGVCSRSYGYLEVHNVPFLTASLLLFVLIFGALFYIVLNLARVPYHYQLY